MHERSVGTRGLPLAAVTSQLRHCLDDAEHASGRTGVRV